MIRISQRLALQVSALLVSFLVACSALHAQSEIKGQRIFFSGHSFHYFMPPILDDLAKKAQIKDHTQIDLSSIGGSRVIQHWNPPTTTVAKVKDKDKKDLVDVEIALPAEKITVVTAGRFPMAGEITVHTADGDVVITYTDRIGNTFTGCKGGKGTLKSGNKVTTTTTAAREALKSGKVDVFTMAPIYLPDDGIEKFVELGLKNNPKMRFFVQENWLPWDFYDADLVAKVGPQVAFKAPGGKVDHNAPTAESLRKMHAVYFKTIDDHVAELNKKYQTKAVRVAPVGQAILKLREKIIAGEAPGLKQQNDLFSDPIGHAKAPLQALVAYCYLALIYEHNPVGLPAPAVLGKADAKLNRMLQEIAWEAVTSHPLSGVTADKR
jgi:hypothetical protein